MRRHLQEMKHSQLLTSRETGHTGNGVAKITRLDPDKIISKRFFRSPNNLFIICFLTLISVQGNLYNEEKSTKLMKSIEKL